jgi:5,10-methylenetetrahydromethanopterin reductase
MREWVHIVRELLALKRITYEGKVFQVRDLALDLGFGMQERPRAVPIYVGATGTEMLELSGEIADGVLLNAFTSVPYIRSAVAAIQRGTRRGKRSFGKFDRPQLVSLAMSKDGAKARDAARYLVTLYLGQQPHIAQASGVKADLLRAINRELGGWPPKKGGPKRAMQLVDDHLVEFLTAAGTAEECRQKVREYQAAGSSYPVLLPITFNYDEMIEAFAPH